MAEKGTDFEKVVIVSCNNYSDSVKFRITEGYEDVSSLKFQGVTSIKSFAVYVVGDSASEFFENKGPVIIPEAVNEMNKKVKGPLVDIRDPRVWYFTFKKNKLVRVWPEDVISANCKECVDFEMRLVKIMNNVSGNIVSVLNQSQHPRC